MNDRKKIVIVDNDENITSLLSVNLRSEGYEVVVRADAGDVMPGDLAEASLVIADGMDSAYSGLEFLQDLKANPKTSQIGFILYSVNDSERIVIEALDAGADDYIVKPFSLRELVARTKAVIRRHSRTQINPSVTAETDAAPEVLRFHSLTLDPRTGRVTDGDNVLTMTKTEYLILQLLVKNVNNYVSRSEIYSQVWNNNSEKSNERIVDTNISRLRKKLGELSACLINRPGLGYMMKL